MATGIVLAAGRSSRMGRDKALLDLAGRSFLAAASSALLEGGCREVVVVLGPGSDRASREAEGLGLTVVLNKEPGAEQVDSLRLGLRSAGADSRAALALPVDHPLVRAATVRVLVDRHEEDPLAIVRPVYRGRPGHPTLFPRPVWPALAERPLPRGARTVVESPGTRTIDVPVDDRGVLADIDTPQRYRALRAGDMATVLQGEP